MRVGKRNVDMLFRLFDESGYRRFMVGPVGQRVGPIGPGPQGQLAPLVGQLAQEWRPDAHDLDLWTQCM